MPRRYVQQLRFPGNGVSEITGFENQPEGTSVDVQNVRLFPANTGETHAITSSDGLKWNTEFDGRGRGGQRPGLSKHMSTPFNSAYPPPIQNISHITWSKIVDLYGQGHTIINEDSGGNYRLLDKDGVEVGTGGASGSANYIWNLSVWGDDGYGYIASVYQPTTTGAYLQIVKVGANVDVDTTKPTVVKSKDYTTEITIDQSANRPVRGMQQAGDTLYVWVGSVKNAGVDDAIYRIDTMDLSLRDDGPWLTSNNGDIYQSGNSAITTYSNLMTITRGRIGLLVLNNAVSSSVTSGDIAHNATDSTVQSTLVSMANISDGDVACTGGPLNVEPVNIEFTGNLANRNIPIMRAIDGASTPTVVTEVQILTLKGSPTGGNFKLSFTNAADNKQTMVGTLDHDCTAGDVESALEGLSNIAATDLTVTGGFNSGTTITVTFGGTLDGTAPSLLAVEANSLTGGTDPEVGVAQVMAGSAVVKTVTPVYQGNKNFNETQQLTYKADSGYIRLILEPQNSLQVLDLHSGDTVAVTELQTFGSTNNYGLGLAADDFGNFYSLVSNSSGTDSFVYAKHDNNGVEVWLETQAGNHKDIVYDFVGDRVVLVGGNCAGTSDSLATINAGTGAKVASASPYDDYWNPVTGANYGITIWLEISADPDGGFRLGRNHASYAVAKINSSLEEEWITSSGGVNQRGLSCAGIHALNPAASTATRQTQSLAIAGGTIKEFRVANAFNVQSSEEWVTVTGGDKAFDPHADVIWSAQFNDDVFFAFSTGKKVFDTSAKQLVEWTPSSGSYPVDSDGKYPSLIAVWRNRMVLAGLPGEPHGWFMSKIGDPLNFDYAGTGADSASAGSSAPVGRPADKINAIIPMTDEDILFGCDHTAWLLHGDPESGGRLHLLTDSIGIAYGQGSWCKDPQGNLFVFGSRGGVYQIGAGGGGVNKISSTAVDHRLSNIDLSRNRVHMVWNEREQGLHLFITPLRYDGVSSSSATKNAFWNIAPSRGAPEPTWDYFWDSRTTSWWVDIFANANHQPRCTHIFDGDDPNDRAILLGGYDGCIRKWDASSATDDGTNIDSHVWIGPLSVGQMGGMMIHEVQTVLGGESTSTNLDIFRGDSAEQAYNQSTSAFTESISAGRNGAIRTRAGGRSLYIRLSNTGSGGWTFEDMRCTYSRTSDRFARRSR